MSLSRLSKEEITDLSLIEFVNEMLQEAGEQPITFDDITSEIEKYHTFTDEEDKFEKLAQLYTDMNIDGNFVNVGANRWSLRAWYPFDKSDEDLVIEARQRGELDEFEEEFNYDAEEDEFETILKTISIHSRRQRTMIQLTTAKKMILSKKSQPSMISMTISTKKT